MVGHPPDMKTGVSVRAAGVPGLRARPGRAGPQRPRAQAGLPRHGHRQAQRCRRASSSRRCCSVCCSTAWRVPRPMPVAIALTGVGFTLVKASAAGAAVASGAWSLTGVPTPDPRRPHRPARAARLVRRVAGAPPGLGTASGRLAVRAVPGNWRRDGAGRCRRHCRRTSCDDYRVSASTISRWCRDSSRDRPSQPETRIVFSWDNKYVDVTGRLGKLPRYGLACPTAIPMSAALASGRATTPAGAGASATAMSPALSMSLYDGGRRGNRRTRCPTTVAKQAIEGVDDTGCGNKPRASLGELAVLGSGAGAVVAVAAEAGGLLLRTPDSSWRLVTLDELDELPDPPDPTPLEGFISPVPARPTEEETPVLPGEETRRPHLRGAGHGVRDARPAQRATDDQRLLPLGHTPSRSPMPGCTNVSPRLSCSIAPGWTRAR